MDRKTFIKKSLGVMLIALPTYSFVSCTNSDDGSGNTMENPNNQGEANCTSNGTQSSISANHGHTLTVPSSDVVTGTARTYSIQGSSGHDHMVTLSANDFASLQNNNSISVNSTNDDGHTHSVTVSCV